MSGSTRDQATSARVAGSLSGASLARPALERVEAGYARHATQEQSLTAAAASAGGRQSLTASVGTHSSPVAGGAGSLVGNAAAFVDAMMWVARIFGSGHDWFRFA